MAGKTIFDLTAAPSAPLAGDIFEFERETSPGIWESFKQPFSNWPSGGASIISGRTTFVDALFGDDATGELYNIAKPFATISAAQLAASSGELLWIKSCTFDYTDISLGKHGLSYFFEPGANMYSSGYCFYDSGSSMNFRVFGYGDFRATLAICRLQGASSIATFEGNYALGIALGARGFWVGNGCSLDVNIKTDIYCGAGAGGEACVRVDTHASSTPYLRVRARNIISESVPLQTKNNNNNGTLIVYAECVSIAPGFDNYTLLEFNGGDVEIHAKCKTEDNSNYGIGMFYGGGQSLKVYGDMNIQSDKCIALVGGLVDFYGKIDTLGTNVNNGAIVTFHNNVYTNSGNPCISHSSGSTFIRGFVNEASGMAASVTVANASGLVLRGGAILFSPAAVPAVDTATAANVVIYPGATSNGAVSGAITELISSLVVSADVYPEQ